MPRRSTWAELFAVKRRAIDRAILAEAERKIAAEELEAFKPPPDLASDPISFSGPSAQEEAESARAAIARAFGRPLR